MNATPTLKGGQLGLAASTIGCGLSHEQIQTRAGSRLQSAALSHLLPLPSASDPQGSAPTRLARLPLQAQLPGGRAPPAALPGTPVCKSRLGDRGWNGRGWLRLTPSSPCHATGVPWVPSLDGQPCGARCCVWPGRGLLPSTRGPWYLLNYRRGTREVNCGGAWL